MLDYYKIYALHRKKGWVQLCIMHDGDKAINYVDNLEEVTFLTGMIIKHHIDKNMDEPFYLKSCLKCEEEKRRVKRR